MGPSDKLKKNNTAPIYRDFNADQVVVATSCAAAFLVTRSKGTLSVWSSAGEKLHTIEALVAQDDVTTSRHAISSDGLLLAEGSDALIRVTHLASKKQLWQINLRESMYVLWGDPAFSPDGRLLALPLQGRVSLVNTQTGKLVRDIGHNWIGPPGRGIPYAPLDGITLARRVYFSEDGKVVGIACSANRESSSNHTLFVAEVASGEAGAQTEGEASTEAPTAPEAESSEQREE